MEGFRGRPRRPSVHVLAGEIAGAIIGPSLTRMACSRTALAAPARGTTRARFEGIVGYCRRNFLVPMPRFRNFEDPSPETTAASSCGGKMKPARRISSHDDGPAVATRHAVGSPRDVAPEARSGSQRRGSCAAARALVLTRAMTAQKDIASVRRDLSLAQKTNALDRRLSVRSGWL